MSELNGTQAVSPLRHSLLLTVSVFALAGSACALPAEADDLVSRPTVWLELGGQWSQGNGQPEPFTPPFTLIGQQHGLMSATDLSSMPKSSIDGGGSITFQPEGSQWKFSASVQYGRSNANKSRHQQNPVSVTLSDGELLYINGPNNFSYLDQTADYSIKSSESHAIVDFSVGKDVGLGLGGGKSYSQIEFGIRFAQFSAKSSMSLRADPYPHRSGFKYFTPSHKSIPFNVYYQFYNAKPEFSRSFRGLGPSLSWNGSIPVLESGDSEAKMTVDWGANVGILFGRQKAQIHHHTTGNMYTLRPFDALSGLPKYTEKHYANSANVIRSRSIVVPNVGGLAGISLKFSNAKVSLGYRADFFFGAMDGGVDTRKSYDRSFYGPFATISIGLGG